MSTNRPTDRRPGTLFLVTRGRTSGQVRRNGLYYIEDGTAYVVVASNAGADEDPGWWRNLQADPEAGVEIGGRTTSIRARPATDEEAARLLPRLDAVNSEFAVYRARTRRPMPVVILERR